MTGIITDDDEKLLKGEKTDTSERAKEQQRIRLRRRIRESINDFPTLLNHLEPEDYQAIFQPKDDDKEKIHVSTIAALGFFYHGTENHTDHAFSDLIEIAKKQAQFAQEKTTEITGKCPSCGSKHGMKLSEPTNAALLSAGIEAVCDCGETVQLKP